MKKKSFGVNRSDVNPAEEEEGIRSSSFLEVPGIHEIKGKIKKHLSEMGMPGAKLAGDAVDLLVPEDADAIGGLAKKGIKSAMTKMAAHMPKASETKAVKSMAEEVRDLMGGGTAVPKKEALDYGKIAAGEAEDRAEKLAGVSKSYKSDGIKAPDVTIIDSALAEKRRAEGAARVLVKKELMAQRAKAAVANLKR